MITVTLETAKKLKEAWRKKRCYFEYNRMRCVHEEKNSYVLWSHSRMRIPTLNKEEIHQEFIDNPWIEAPTAQEILDELPKAVEGGYLNIEIDERWAYAIYIMDQQVHWDIEVYQTLVEALANLRIRCKENWYLLDK